MTSYQAVAEELKAAGAQYADEPVVVDRNLITSRNPGDLAAFVQQMLQSLRSAAP